MASIALSPAPATADAPGRADTPLIRYLAPGMVEIATLILAAGFGALGLAIGGAMVDLLNIALPAVLMTAMAASGYRMVRGTVACIWTPLLWMRAAVFFYGGFGTLVALLSGAATRAYMATFFNYFSSDVLKFNVVLLLFVSSALLTIRAMVALVEFRKAETGEARLRGLWHFAPSALGLEVVGGFFLVTGGVISFFLVLPQAFGYIRTAIPGAIAGPAQLAMTIGLFMVTSGLARRRSPLLYVAVGFGLLLALIGLLTFSKTTLLLPIIMVALGLFYHRPSIIRLLFTALVVLAPYVLANPIVSYGREMMIARYGDIAAPAGAAERIQILNDYFRSDTPRTQSDTSGAITRFSYVNVATYAIHEYDSGRPGDSYRYAPVVLIPRLVWKDKPIITDVGRELNYAATGNWYSSVGATLPAEAYWNGGWTMVVVIAAIVGLIIGLWSIYALSVQVFGAWHLFLIVLLGANVGSRFDGAFVSDVIGSLGIAVLGHLVLTVANAALGARAPDG